MARTLDPSETTPKSSADTGRTRTLCAHPVGDLHCGRVLESAGRA